MSHTRITIPITVEHVECPGDVRLMSMRSYVKDRRSAQYRFVPDRERRPSGPFDPWELREALLTWNPEEWEVFVYMAGNFGPGKLTENDFLEWQKLVKSALLTPPANWQSLKNMFSPEKVEKLLAPLPITFQWESSVPTACIKTRRSLSAIIASIQIDALQGSQFKVCARHDCHSAPFKVEARQKIYCSAECAHLVAVRESRKRQAGQSQNKASEKTSAPKKRRK